MKSKDFINGLQILMLYYDDQDGYHFDPNDDRFIADKTDRPLSDEDQMKMTALGWEQKRNFGDWIAYW